MKRATAVRHLREMAEVASDKLRLRGTDIGWPLEELWAAGELLGLADQMEVGSVVLRLDVPVGELPWLALHPTGEWIGHLLRLGKRPIAWSYRPLGWPVWNHEHQRLVRVWSADSGTDEEVLEALRTRRLDSLPLEAPAEEELRAQLEVELAASHAHLRSVVDGYWERDWRKAHRDHEIGPEDHLWRAAIAVSDIHDALRRPTLLAPPT